MKQSLVVPVKTLSPSATLPEAKTAGAGARDLCAAEALTIAPGARALVHTGFAMELPDGFVGLVCSRSGLALKHGVFVLNAPGIIDSDYRGEIGAILQNAGSDPFEVKVGDRVAQLMVMPSVALRFASAEDLSETARGAGGFGSTGRA